jgi:hypothetical protein
VLADGRLGQKPTGAGVALLHEPANEPLDVAGLDLREAQAPDVIEVRDDTVVKHLPVGGACRLAEPSRRPALVVGDPVAGVVAEADARQVDELAPVGVGLGLTLATPGVVEGGGAPLALAALDPV